MARIRTVKPDFFRHELLQDLQTTHPNECPMIVFAGLFGHCDKQGVFRWRPKQLKLDILPFMAFDMERALEILLAADLVRRFTQGGDAYGLIPTFEDHQAIGGKEATKPPRYPNPPGEVMVKKRGSDGEATGTAGIRNEELGKERKGKEDVASRAEARSPAGPVNGNAVAYIPLNDGTEFAVTPEHAAELTRLYPRVDVPQTLNEIRGWNLANPTRKKTRRGVLSHINAWMQKEQNRGPQTR